MPRILLTVPCRECRSSFPPLVMSRRRKPPVGFHYLWWGPTVSLLLRGQTRLFPPSSGGLGPSGKVLGLRRLSSSKFALQSFPSLLTSISCPPSTIPPLP